MLEALQEHARQQPGNCQAKLTSFIREPSTEASEVFKNNVASHCLWHCVFKKRAFYNRVIPYQVIQKNDKMQPTISDFFEI